MGRQGRHVARPGAALTDVAAMCTRLAPDRLEGVLRASDAARIAVPCCGCWPTDR